jgi:hypothetical protein
MSAMGHKRTFAAQKGMSALPPKADICSATRYVRFVPIADMDGSTIVPQIGANGILRNICSGKQIVESHR